MIENLIKLFEYYKSLGERTFDQLSDDELHLEPAEDANSIAIIVNHLWGNMMSRWTHFLDEDGEKEWRNRDSEFETIIRSRADLNAKWVEGWGCLLDTLKQLKESDLSKTIYIRNEGHTVIDAIYRQLAHYSYHTGQIVYLAKMIKGKDWTSLSIPKGESKAYNLAKFGETKSTRHFTDRA